MPLLLNEENLILRQFTPVTKWGAPYAKEILHPFVTKCRAPYAPVTKCGNSYAQTNYPCDEMWSPLCKKNTTPIYDEMQSPLCPCY